MGKDATAPPLFFRTTDRANIRFSTVRYCHLQVADSADRQRPENNGTFVLTPIGGGLDTYE